MLMCILSFIFFVIFFGYFLGIFGFVGCVMRSCWTVFLLTRVCWRHNQLKDKVKGIWRIFFQNNTKIQTIWLFSKLTSWVQETWFWCAKLSITDSSSIKLEGRNPNHTKKENKPEGRNPDQTKKKHEEGKQIEEIKRRRNKHEETQIKRRRNKHEETQTKWRRKKPTNPDLLKANRST